MEISGTFRVFSAVAGISCALALAGTAAAAPGDLDPSYGLGTGATRADFGLNESAAAVALQADGKIVVAGTQFVAGDPASTRMVAARFLNPQGTADPSFGAGGLAIPFPARIGDSQAMVLQSDGGIVIAGNDRTAGDSDMFVTRLSGTNGSLDLTYGIGSGGSLVSLGFQEYGDDVALQPDGKIVVGGSGTVAGGAYQLLVARLNNPLGTSDSSFGPLGAGWSRPAIGDMTARRSRCRQTGRSSSPVSRVPPPARRISSSYACSTRRVSAIRPSGAAPPW